MRPLLLVAICAILAVRAPDRAQADTPYLYLGPQISTLGFGGEVGVRVNSFIGVRGGGNYFAIDFDQEFTDIDYDVDLQLASAGGVVDIYPLGNGFRVSGGMRWNGNDADLKAKPNGSIDIGGTTFNSTQVSRLRGNVDFNDFAPYAGVGFQSGFFGNRVEFAFDLGVLFQGDPDVDLDADGTLANDPTLRARLREEEKDIEDDLEWLGFYPVAALTVTVHF